ncbi:MAG: cytidylate kinase family protein [Verrucomicrobia bacterium]|nr:cytidylate kinase family protein [Verrucomicrobiota bacterium]
MSAQLSSELAMERPSAFRGTLTVSREAGARAIPICELLADYLSEEDETAEYGWILYNKDFCEKMAGMNCTTDIAAFPRHAEACQSVDDYITALLGTHHCDRAQFRQTSQTIRTLARLGNAILIGRGSNFITADLDNAFHIRLIGREATRLAYIQQTQNLNRAAALSYLHSTDHERRTYVKSQLQKDVEDPLAYHAIIRTDDISDELLARMIGDLFMDWVAARKPEPEKLVIFAQKTPLND